MGNSATAAKAASTATAPDVAVIIPPEPTVKFYDDIGEAVAHANGGRVYSVVRAKKAATTYCVGAKSPAAAAEAWIVQGGGSVNLITQSARLKAAEKQLALWYTEKAAKAKEESEGAG